MTRPKLPAATPLTDVLANATAALKAEEGTAGQALYDAAARHLASVDISNAAYGVEAAAVQIAGYDNEAHAPALPEPATSDDDAIVQSAGETLPYLFSLQENFILAVGEHTRGSKALGYAEFCLRNKMAEALTEYVLQVRTEEGVDAPALVRALTVLKQAAAGHKGEK